jgi:hypothetical protein
MLGDRLDVATRHGNGLPSGALAGACLVDEADRALSLAGQSIAFDAKDLRVVEDP